MSYGFRGKIHSMVRAMDTLRMQRKGEMPRDISLRQYVAENYKDGAGHPMTLDVLLNDVGVNPFTTPVRELMADDDLKWLVYEACREGIRRGMGISAREELTALRNAIRSLAITGQQGGGERWISPEVFLDPVQRAAIQYAFYNELIIRSITVNNTKVTMPRIELSDAAMVDSEEAATIEEGTVVYGDKDVKVTKSARGIKVTDEAIMFNSIDFLMIWVEQLGRKLAAKKNGKAVTVLVNGDQDDLSENAAVVGIADTDEGMQYRDILWVWVTMGLIGRLGNTLVAGPEVAVDYLDMPPVRDRQNIGNVLLPTQVHVPIPSSTDLFPASQVADDQLLVVDKSAAMVELVAQPLRGESERFASKGLNGTYFSEYSGFAIVQRDARVVIDRTLTLAAHPFPSWFDANEGD